MNARSSTLCGLVLIVVACGGTRPGPFDPDAATDAGADFTIVRGEKCCVEGIGAACCGDGMTARPEGQRCARYGGALGRCGRPADPYDVFEGCSICCAGLRPMRTSRRLADGSCSNDGHSLICAACGDGVCDAASGENDCSCPGDCAATSDGGKD